MLHPTAMRAVGVTSRLPCCPKAFSTAPNTRVGMQEAMVFQGLSNVASVRIARNNRRSHDRNLLRFWLGSASVSALKRTRTIHSLGQKSNIMNSICVLKSPGFCSHCNRNCRWPDIQSCRSNGPPGTPPAPPARSCRDCVHRGAPALAANGKQIGTEGCGCTSESAPSGVLWWFCGLTGDPARESKAARCENFAHSESP